MTSNIDSCCGNLSFMWPIDNLQVSGMFVFV